MTVIYAGSPPITREASDLAFDFGQRVEEAILRFARAQVLAAGTNLITARDVDAAARAILPAVLLAEVVGDGGHDGPYTSRAA